MRRINTKGLGLLVIGMVLGLVAAYAYVVVAVNARVADGQSDINDRRAAIERAADVALSGARLWKEIPQRERDAGQLVIRVGASESLPGAMPEQIHGEESRSGPFVFDEFVMLRLHDWSNVTIEPGGNRLITAMLEQANLQSAELAKAKFACIATSGWGEDQWAQPAAPGADIVNVAVLRNARWGGGTARGTGGYSVNTRSPRIVHWRLYAHLTSAATLAVRSEYDQASKRLFTEWIYSDRTFLGTNYPAVTWSLQEQIK